MSFVQRSDRAITLCRCVLKQLDSPPYGTLIPPVIAQPSVSLAHCQARFAEQALQHARHAQRRRWRSWYIASRKVSIIHRRYRSLEGELFGLIVIVKDARFWIVHQCPAGNYRFARPKEIFAESCFRKRDFEKNLPAIERGYVVPRADAAFFLSTAREKTSGIVELVT